MNYYKKPMIISLVMMIVAIMMVVVFCHGFNHGVTATRSSMYSMVGYIVEVNRDEDYSAIENTAGDIFLWESAEWWQIGDIVAMTMDDHGTLDVEDDEILDMTLAYNE